MLDSEGMNNIEIIKEVANRVWDNAHTFGEIEVSSAEFCEFKQPMRIYDKFDVLLTYDRSILGINVKIEGNFQNLRHLTKESLIRGFDSCKYESVEHNFKILDAVLRNMKGG